MMSDGEVTYSITLMDNVSPTVERMTQGMGEMETATDKANKNLDSQRIGFMTGIMGIMAFDRGIRGITTSMLGLGIISKDNEESVRKLNNGVMLVSSSLMLLKGGIQVMNWLKDSTIALAAWESYRTVLKNPAMMGLVMTGLAVAGGVAGYAMGSSNTNVNQNVTFTGSSIADQRKTAAGVVQTMGG